MEKNLSKFFASSAVIVDNLKTLDDLLKKDVDLKDVKDIQDNFADIILACEFYLKNRNPWSDEGKARKQMVQDFYDEVRVESMRFSQRLDQLSSGTEAVEGKKWVDYLREVRTQKFEDGVDNVEITEGGAGTSKVYIIKKGNKRQYFKENEKMPSDNFDELIKSERKRLKEEFDDYAAEKSHSKKEIDNYRNLLGGRQQKLQLIRDSLNICFESQNDINNFLDDYRAPSQIYQAIRNVLKGRHNVKTINTSKMLKDDYDLYEMLKQEYKEINDAYELAKENKDGTEEELLKKLNTQKAAIKNCDYIYLSETILDISKKMRCHGIANGDAMIEEGAELSKRNVATARLARILGLNSKEPNGPKLIAESSLADVTINGKYMQGIIMEEAPGNILDNIAGDESLGVKETKYSPQVFRDLLSLQIFDIILGQVDRNGSNYLGMHNFNKDKNCKEITSIMGIDNDMCGGLLYYEDIQKTGKRGLNRIRNIEVNGRMMIPGMDREFAQAIKKIEPELIHHELCDILNNEEERKALIDRINGIKKAIIRQEQKEKKNKNRSTKFINRNDIEKWKLLMKNYSTKVREKMEEDRKAANEHYERRINEFNANTKYMNKGQQEQELASINAEFNNRLKQTENEVKKTTYLRVKYL